VSSLAFLVFVGIVQGDILYVDIDIDVVREAINQGIRPCEFKFSHPHRLKLLRELVDN